MCRRNTDDPLVRMFLDRYHLHLLAIPRHGVAVGDLYVHDGKRVSPPGNVQNILDAPMEMPPLKIGELMGEVSGLTSKAVAVNVGLGLLAGFLTALGAASVVDKVKAAYAHNNAGTLRFRFAGATRDSVDVLALASRIARRRLAADQPFVTNGNRYYLVTGVARASSLSVVAESGGGAGATLGLDVKQIVGVATSIKIDANQNGEVIFTGPEALAFGVELHELVYDEDEQRLEFKMPENAIRVRNAADTPATPLLTPATIGGPEDDVFLTVG